MTQKKDDELSWEVQKICADIKDYELTIVRQKNEWHCSQKIESWKWSVAYHGSIVCSGAVNSLEEAKLFAQKNTP